MTKHASNTFVTHAVFFFLPFCCADSLTGSLKTTTKATAKQKGIELHYQTKTSLHVHHTFFVHFIAVVGRPRR